MSKNKFLLNPINGGYSFGTFPEIKTSGVLFEEGEVRLRHGHHVGPNRGFGAVHIWEEHQIGLKDFNIQSLEDVPNFILQICRSNTGIYCEFSDIRGNHRPILFKSAIGVAIIERKTLGDNTIFYSIVTAFPKGKAHGTRIGTMRL